MRRYALLMRWKFLFVGLAGLCAGFAADRWLIGRDPQAETDNVLAMAWGDGGYGKAFYGAQAYVEPKGGRFEVHAVIRIGHGNDYFNDCGLLDTVDTFEEAVQKWGKIEWRPDGVHIGSYFLPQSKIESHR